jgi:hypothetical protein
MIRCIAIRVIVAAFVGLLGFLFLAWRPAIARSSALTKQASLLRPSPEERFSPRPDIVSHATPDRAGNHSPVDTGERPIWDHLREQYHARPEDRGRCVVIRGLYPRHA